MTVDNNVGKIKKLQVIGGLLNTSYLIKMLKIMCLGSLNLSAWEVLDEPKQSIFENFIA